MLRPALLLAALPLLAPATAAAAPFGELPSRPVSGAATCLRATGAPGELIRQTKRSLQFLGATPSGPAPGTVLKAERIAGCAEVASTGAGAAVVAFAVSPEASEKRRVTAYVREPGQGWSADAPITVTTGEFATVDLAVAVSESGDALVAEGSLTSNGTAKVVVARRAPGGAFGAPATLRVARSSGFSPPSVSAGLSATGEAIVAWSQQPRDELAPSELWVAIAPPGAAFGAPVRAGALKPGAPFELAVAPDGRALLVFPSTAELLVAEREPGAAWGTPSPLATPRGGFGVVPTVALRPDGAAVVAWSDLSSGRTLARVRDRPGPFAAAMTLSRGYGVIRGIGPLMELTAALLGSFGGEIGISGASPDSSGGNPRARYTEDGRALVTWVAPVFRDGVSWTAANAAFLGAASEPFTLGAELRDAGSITPVITAGGVPAVAWTDNAPRERDGRVHLALEGAPDAADPPAPTVRVGAPVRRVLGNEPKLVLPVSCSAACEVRAQVEGSLDGVATVSRRTAGAGTLVLESSLAPIAPLRAGPVRVLVRYGAPGTRRAAARTLTYTLRRVPEPPVPRVRGLSARRDGDEVVVRWHADTKADPDSFALLGFGGEGERAVFKTVDGRARASFTLHVPDPGRRLRRVKVYAGTTYALRARTASAAVRG